MLRGLVYRLGYVPGAVAQAKEEKLRAREEKLREQLRAMQEERQREAEARRDDSRQHEIGMAKLVSEHERRLAKATEEISKSARQRAAFEERLEATVREGQAMAERVEVATRELVIAREHLMAIEVKLDILEGAANVLDGRLRAARAQSEGQRRQSVDGASS